MLFISFGKKQGPRFECALLLLVVVACSGGAALAQTVRPIISEHKKTARGRVELVNDGPIPLAVVVSPKGFQVSEDGEVTYTELPSEIKLKLSTMSFRIAPGQTYYVFYEAKAEKIPAWFILYFEFSGYPVRDRSGLNVQVELPHTVYILPKQLTAKSEVRVEARYDPDTKRIIGKAENTGASFGRVQMTEASAPRTRKQGYGFPLFPKSNRTFAIDWDAAVPPEKLVLRFEEFSLETSVR
ncbi:MAG TPA: hypothetical protein VEB03_00800 [Candidatus Nanoarchaeia archaeon]|nr:hypothetical protein [Candidatus Nanoarchaeia archaeon]